MKDIPEKLRIGRRTIEQFRRIQILQDFIWSEPLNIWFLQFSVETESTKPEVPCYSAWYLVASSKYPKGPVKIYPSIVNGIDSTFPHQADNSEIEKTHCLWRLGAPCLEKNIQSLNLRFADPEPMLAEKRIEWHLWRLLGWIDAAKNDLLVQDGEAYELPQIRKKIPGKIVYSEDAVNTYIWQDTAEQNEYFGFVSLIQKTELHSTWYTESFSTRSNDLVHRSSWGSFIDKSDYVGRINGIWILLKDIPTIKIWQFPTTYGELRQVLKSQGVDFFNILSCLDSIRDGRAHFVLLGFPIPRYFYREIEEFTWIAFQLPVLARQNVRIPGFRQNAQGLPLIADRRNVLNDKESIWWISTENWNQNTISSRGRLHMPLCRSRILVIGAGCIGASIAELLVRGGVDTLGIIDEDTLETGNLSRHTLLIDDLSDSKAIRLAKRLNGASPNVKITAYNYMLDEDNIRDILVHYNVIIDCTGENDVLQDLSTLQSDKDKLIISISISYAAKHLFVAIVNGKKFHFDSFLDIIREYLEPQEETGVQENEVIKNEAIGCWHPLFPARCDEVWLAATTAIQAVNRYFESKLTSNLVLVYKQLTDGFEIGYTLEKQHVL
jgi:hypothetical protein